ncbi:3-isopropylmalate dehydratase small subunit [Ignicoccus pacificus DSM 13166]|uniref:3-isopropylmalate dehydratase small subunit n=1 Tax=Ignicoccus pacificus DSM 13166 TaxID=940294 RepID=A0A977KBN4_9CREN|nr:3-isopropylmalate dehydratase small subunit [Ignicoccus pacificus DSM 13166]
MVTKVRAKAIKVGDNIDTDVIIPGRYLIYTDPETLGRHCFEPIMPDFYERSKKLGGVIVVGGRNFGMGSSREQAVVALRGAGVKAVVAESFARIFYRNCINQGLPAVKVPGISKVVEEGDEVEVDLEEGAVRVYSPSGELKKEFKVAKLPPSLLEILESGGLVPYLKKKMVQ